MSDTETSPSASSDEALAREPLFRRAVAHTRGLVLAEALVLVVLGFTADDLQLLRAPGYLVGLGAALLVLLAGGLVHGHRLAARLDGLDDEAVDAALNTYQRKGHLAALLAAVGFLAWAVFFTTGVPPWAL